MLDILSDGNIQIQHYLLSNLTIEDLLYEFYYRSEKVIYEKNRA